MEKDYLIGRLFIETAFSCMACDGDIDSREINLILDLHKNQNLFLIDDAKEALNFFVSEINKKGELFFHDYFKFLRTAKLSKDEEIAIARIALKIIEADEIIKYSEIKFFKIIRSKLKVSNEELIKALAEFENIDEYLQDDILSTNSREKLYSDYFDSHNVPQFEKISIDNMST